MLNEGENVVADNGEATLVFAALKLWPDQDRICDNQSFAVHT